MHWTCFEGFGITVCVRAAVIFQLISLCIEAKSPQHGKYRHACHKDGLDFSTRIQHWACAQDGASITLKNGFCESRSSMHDQPTFKSLPIDFSQNWRGLFIPNTAIANFRLAPYFLCRIRIAIGKTFGKTPWTRRHGANRPF